MYLGSTLHSCNASIKSFGVTTFVPRNRLNRQYTSCTSIMPAPFFSAASHTLDMSAGVHARFASDFFSSLVTPTRPAIDTFLRRNTGF